MISAEAPPGGSSPVRITIPVERLALRIDEKWVIEPGPYEIAVGLHAHDPKAVVMRVEIR